MTFVYSMLLDSDLYNKDYFLQENICRFCWSKNANRDLLTNICEMGSEVNNPLIYKVKNCLDINLDLEITTNHPKKVCESCFCKIESFYEFKRFCEDTDRKLREIFEKDDLNPSAQLTESSNNLKLEKLEDFPELDLSKSDTLDSFLYSLQPSSPTLEDPPEHTEITKKTKTSRYKPKRGSSYCNICCFDFKSRETLIQHNSESHGVESNGEFKCFGCEKRFKTRKTRLGHEINFCKGLKDGYKCSLCDRYLPKRRMYESHMRDHRNNTTIELPEELFKCSKCYKQFKTRENLKKHMKVHDGEKKNYVCETCGRVFTRQDYLYKHTLTHSGVKRHVCPQCGFRSAQRSSLTVHMRKHTGERPYRCDVCPQQCVSSSNLRAHRRRHLGLNSYQCAFCPKKYGYKTSLEEHIAATHERTQSHPCPRCGATYTRVRGLRRHLLAKHGAEAKHTQKNEKIDQGVSYPDGKNKNPQGDFYPDSNNKNDEEFYSNIKNEKVSDLNTKNGKNEMEQEFYVKIADTDKYVCLSKASIVQCVNNMKTSDFHCSK